MPWESATANVASYRDASYHSVFVSQVGSSRCRHGLTARIWTRFPDCSVTIEASPYAAMPYRSPCASSHAASGAVAGLTGGRVAAVSSASSAMSPVAATAAKARGIAVIRAGTRARAASTAPHGSTAATSREPLGKAITETRYVPTLKMIAATSSCSARLARRQVQITRARPNRAASRQISPKAAPATPSLVPGPATDPNRTRMFCHVTDACWSHSLGGASRALGGTVTNPPTCVIAAWSADSSGTDTTAAATSAVSPQRSFRAASAR